MKKNNSILYFGVFFAASILAEIYCIVHKINIIGVSIVIVIATYLLLDAVRNERARKEERLEHFFGGHLEQIENTERSLREQLDEIEKVQKAIYVQLKRSTEEIKEQLESAEQNRQRQADSVIEGQNKTAKIIVKYVREDIKKASAISKASCEKITAAVNQGTEKFVEASGRDNFDRGSLLQNIDLNVSRLMETVEKEAARLGQVSENLRDEVRNLPLQAPLMQAVDSGRNPMPDSPVDEIAVSEALEAVVESTDVPIQEVAEEVQAPDEIETSSDRQKMEAGKEVQRSEDVHLMAEIEAVASPVRKEPEPEAKAEAFDANKQLSADEIAALFAAAGEEAEPPQEEQPQQPELLQEESQQPEPEAIVTAKMDDPNRQLSADEIAAMFSALGSGGEEQETDAEPEPVAVVTAPKPTPEIDMSDPNKQLSAEEIAALFASMG